MSDPMRRIVQPADEGPVARLPAAAMAGQAPSSSTRAGSVSFQATLVQSTEAGTDEEIGFGLCAFSKLSPQFLST